MEHSLDTINKYSEINVIGYVTTANRIKRQKISELSSITLGYLHSRKGSRKIKHQKRLRILFDSGCSDTIINQELTTGLHKQLNKKSKWQTKGGTFKTNKTCTINFNMPLFHKHRDITWTAHVDESPQYHSKYDLIIGRDLLIELGIDLNFSNAEVPMQEPMKLNKENIKKLRKNSFSQVNQTQQMLLEYNKF